MGDEVKPPFIEDAPRIPLKIEKGESSSSSSSSSTGITVEKEQVLVSEPVPISLEDDDPVTTTVANTLVTPYSFVGLLTFTFQKNTYYGTAFLIGNSTILTAAHNVQNSGVRSSGFIFTAGYSFDPSTGVKEVATFKASIDPSTNLEQVVVAPQWTLKDDLYLSLPYDYAIITLAPTNNQTAGATLGGYLKLQSNPPDLSPFPITEIQCRNQNPTQQNVGLSNGLIKYSGGGQNFIKNGAIGTPSSAGGPWFTKAGLATYTAMGFTCFIDEKENLDYSPYFDDDFVQFIKSHPDFS